MKRLHIAEGAWEMQLGWPPGVRERASGLVALPAVPHITLRTPALAHLLLLFAHSLLIRKDRL